MISNDKGIVFAPFVGKYYGKNKSLFQKRVLVLGESHYCDAGCVKLRNVTNDVMNAFMDPNAEREDWMKTYRKFERSMVNKITNFEDSSLIWNSVVFYNYLQFPMDKSRQEGTNEQYESSVEAFFAILNEFQPDSVIVWGKRLWRHLPAIDFQENDAYEVGGYTINSGSYTLNNGRIVKVIPVYHPSTGYSWDWWYKVIKPYID